jgi:hypothetical protein
MDEGGAEGLELGREVFRFGEVFWGRMSVVGDKSVVGA